MQNDGLEKTDDVIIFFTNLKKKMIDVLPNHYDNEETDVDI